MSDIQPEEQHEPQIKHVDIGGEVGAAGVADSTASNGQSARVEFGQSLPGQPPAGFPNGPGVNMYGEPIEYASADPKLRTGDVNEIPPPDVDDVNAPGPKGTS